MTHRDFGIFLGKLDQMDILVRISRVNHSLLDKGEKKRKHHYELYINSEFIFHRKQRIGCKNYVIKKYGDLVAQFDLVKGIEAKHGKNRGGVKHILKNAIKNKANGKEKTSQKEKRNSDTPAHRNRRAKHGADNSAKHRATGTGDAGRRIVTAATGDATPR